MDLISNTNSPRQFLSLLQKLILFFPLQAYHGVCSDKNRAVLNLTQMGHFVLRCQNGNFVSFDCSPFYQFFPPLDSAGLVLAEYYRFFLYSLHQLYGHHCFACPAWEYDQSASGFPSDENIFQGCFLVESQLDISVHVHFDVLELVAVDEVELLDNRNVAVYELFGNFEVISFDFVLYHCFLLFYLVFLFCLFFRSLLFLIEIFIRIFLDFLHAPIISSLFLLIPLKIFDLFRYLVDVQVIDLVHLNLFNFFEMISNHKTQLLRGKDVVLSFNERKPHFSCIFHVAENLILEAFRNILVFA